MYLIYWTYVLIFAIDYFPPFRMRKLRYYISAEPMPFHINDRCLLAESKIYRPRPVSGFTPSRIVLAKGSNAPISRRRMLEAIIAAYPQAEVVEAFDTPHNRISLGDLNALSLHYEGKRTLVLAEHNSAIRQSTEEGNTCPNYWHFSPYGFCPYDCSYCYLAGTQGVRYSPTVKIFLNLPEILSEVDRVARQFGKPTAFYLGKLQDGLALDPLTGYSREIISFFATHPLARMTLLTKSADVSNLLALDHRGHSILSWTVNPHVVIESFEPNTPSLEDRILAMEACAIAGYPLRAVVMPIIPMTDWETIYGEFLAQLLSRVRLSRITLGSICSYTQAMRLTEQKLGPQNPISLQLDKRRNSADGRSRFPLEMRDRGYRRLLSVIRKIDPELEVGLCLEESSMFDVLDLRASLGRCNCVL
jgi:DNA repair photolyase